jgi:hypothetical protein
MDDIVNVSIPVEADVAKALNTPRTREAVGRVVSRMLRPCGGEDPLLAAMERLGLEAERRGLTQAMIDEELAAYNAERREPVSPAA